MACFDLTRPGYHLVKFRFEWNIQVPFLQTTDGNGQSLQSPNFYSKEYPGRRWKLQLYDKSSQISICVCHYNCEEKNVNLFDPVTVKMSIMNVIGNKVHKDTLTSNSAQIEFLLTKKDIIQRGSLRENGSCTFYCKILSHVKIGSGIDCVAQNAVQDERAYERMQFAKHPTINDVIFNVRGSEFPAHKNILSYKSPYFYRLFSEHPKNETITIEDVEPEVFQQMLRFMYTGRLTSETMGNMAAALLIAADKYMIEELKRECQNHLLRYMSALNCIEHILNCDLLDPAEHLKKAKEEAATFFQGSSTQVIADDEWEKLVKENPRLMCTQSVKFKSSCFSKK